jgi:hypothetical protein
MLDIPFEEKRAYEKNQDAYPDSRVIGNLAVYWADGKKTLSEIDNLITMEIGRSSLDYLKFYFEFMEKHGMVELER